MCLVAFSYINSVIKEELSSSMLQVLDRSAELINRWLETLMLEPEAIASTTAAKNINNSFEQFDLQNINRYKVLHEKYPDLFQDIYGSNRDGVYHTVVNDGEEIGFYEGNIANRPYFISIMNGGGTQITPPLISRTTGIPTVFIVAPIMDEENKPAGLVGTGISLRYITQVVREMKSGMGSYGFIFTSDGTIVAHSELESVIEEKVTMADLFTDQKLMDKLSSNVRGMFRFNDGEEDVICFYNRIPVTGWQLVSVISTSDLFYPSNKMMQILIIIAALTTILTGCVVYYTMGRLINPLQVFVRKTEEIAAGNLDPTEFPIRSRDEIGALAISFNTMIRNLHNSISRLKMSEDKYRGIFENSMEGILQTTLDGKILIANPSMVRMLRFESERKLINTYTDIGEQLYVNSEDRTHILEKLHKNGMVMNEEMQYRCNDGETIWVSLSANLVRSEGGSPSRIESLVSDISKRKRIEEEREKLFQELIQAQKLDAVGQLAGGIAHDFNNMLAVILGRSELSLLETDISDPNYQAFIDIFDAAEHSANLTKQLLTFARKQSVTPKIIDLNFSIESKLKLLKRIIKEDIDLSFYPESDVWKIFMDSDQIGQIITNLCINARDSIEGIGTIKIRTENVDVNSDISGEYVCLSIEDSGTGIDEETQKHIFEPFFTTKDQGKGTGLGLSTIYGIVKQNDGFIHVYSELGTGTIFKIYFPKHVSSEDATRIDMDEQSLDTFSETVILVEDEQRLLNISNTILQSLGCTVYPAESAEEAIRIAEDEQVHYDLLITDVIMPEMNGYELFKTIHSIRPEIKCLFMSGYSSDILAPKGVMEKGIHFIQKPFSLKGLSEKIKEVMDEP